MKPSLTWHEQARLLSRRGMAVADHDECADFLRTRGYYRLSGYARYFQRAPHDGEDTFLPGTDFEQIRDLHDADEAFRHRLAIPLVRAEVLLRTHYAQIVAQHFGPYESYLDPDFFVDAAQGHERTAELCRRDLDRSKERHILRYRETGTSDPYAALPVWSAVESWSFGTLSKCIERGARGDLADLVAISLGVAKAGFAYRIRTLVYVRNLCAHHGRIWNHSVLDAGPTPNNVRHRAKRLLGQFEPRSIIDVVASLEDILVRGGVTTPTLEWIAATHPRGSAYWEGLARPRPPRDGHR